MTEITGAHLVAAFRRVAEAIEADKDRLSRLDGVIGDGDHGVSMSMGFAAVSEALAGLGPTADPAAIFTAAAKSFLNAVGASSGPLYATAFLRAAAAVKGKVTLDRDAMVDAVAAMAAGIKDRGKGNPGEKTMLDAWLPAAEAMKAARADRKELKTCFEAAIAAGEAGAESTRDMLALKGRASRLGDRVRGHLDPGAASAVVLLKAFATGLG